MANEREASVSCLCGAIGMSIKNISPSVGVCHCHMCRKWGGGPLFAVDCGSDVSFTGEAKASVYDSSAWAERGFCKDCGSHLFYHLKESNQYMIPAGLFNDVIQFEFDHQVFIDEKPGYYCFSNKTEELTGEEVFARYAPPDQS